jgi:hypothetical protein
VRPREVGRMDSKLCRRREFLELLGYTALSVQILPLTAGACAVETAPADSLSLTSSRNSKLGRWADHSHLLYVPLQLFRAPRREGVTLSTTRTFFHSHEVALTQAQLVTVARGGTARVKDSLGVHTFSIELS